MPAKIGVTNLLEIARNLKSTAKTIRLYTKCICSHQKIEYVHKMKKNMNLFISKASSSHHF